LIAKISNLVYFSFICPPPHLGFFGIAS
jgi:hypothetical protein